MSLLAELERRNVAKVGAAYLLAAWLAAQAASIGFPALDAPFAMFAFATPGAPLVQVLAAVAAATRLLPVSTGEDRKWPHVPGVCRAARWRWSVSPA